LHSVPIDVSIIIANKYKIRRIGARVGRILFGSEFGANLGHIYPMLRIANELTKQNHEIIFAARDVRKTREAIRDMPYQVIQAPFWLNHENPKIGSAPTPSYADVIVRQGFGEYSALMGACGAWRDMLDLVAPDLIIADHSPGLSLVARGRFPMINFGNGFTLPPAHLESYPTILAKASQIMSQDLILENVNKVMTALSLKELSFLPQIFETEGQYVVTVDELDPYAYCREFPAIGPLEDCVSPAPKPAEAHVFLYMASGAKGLKQALAALKKSRVRTTAFVRGARQDLLQAYQSDQMTMLTKPADFKEIIPKSSLIVHSGGGGTSTSCLMTGRPQLTFPQHLETATNTRLMSQVGVGQGISDKVSVSDLAGHIRKLSQDSKMLDKALKLSEVIAKKDYTGALDKIMSHANLLARGAGS
jgi:UDP:flavonoid glycosyltransferase YjiC (YdhE family)